MPGRRPKVRRTESVHVEENCGNAPSRGEHTKAKGIIRHIAQLLRDTHVYPQYFFGVPTKVPTAREISRFYRRDDGCILLINMAPEVGLEPTTLRLTAECSAIELLRNEYVACAVAPDRDLLFITNPNCRGQKSGMTLTSDARPRGPQTKIKHSPARRPVAATAGCRANGALHSYTSRVRLLARPSHK